MNLEKGMKWLDWWGTDEVYDDVATVLGGDLV